MHLLLNPRQLFKEPNQFPNQLVDLPAPFNPRIAIRVAPRDLLQVRLENGNLVVVFFASAMLLLVCRDLELVLGFIVGGVRLVVVLRVWNEQGVMEVSAVDCGDYLRVGGGRMEGGDWMFVGWDIVHFCEVDDRRGF